MHLYIGNITAIFACFFNIILICIIKKHKLQFQNFLLILKIAIVVDTFMALMTFICQPIAHVGFGYIICFCINPLLSKNVYAQWIVAILQGWAIVATVLCLPIQFAYRYQIVKK